MHVTDLCENMCTRSRTRAPGFIVKFQIKFIKQQMAWRLLQVAKNIQ